VVIVVGGAVGVVDVDVVVDVAVRAGAVLGAALRVACGAGVEQGSST
jgi:hypothetical protein